MLRETGVDLGDVDDEREPVAELLGFALGGGVNLGGDVVGELHAAVVVVERERGHHRAELDELVLIVLVEVIGELPPLGEGVDPVLVVLGGVNLFNFFNVGAEASLGSLLGGLSLAVLAERRGEVRGSLVVVPVGVRRLEGLAHAVRDALHAGDVVIRPVGPVTNRRHGVQHKLGESVDGHFASLLLAANAGVDTGEVLIEAGGDVRGTGEVRELLHELIEGRLGGTVADSLELVGQVDHLVVLGLLDVRDGLEHLVEVLAGLRGQVIDHLRPDAGRVVDLPERRVLLAGVHGTLAHLGHGILDTLTPSLLLAHLRGGGGALLGARGDDAHLVDVCALPLGEVAGGG